MANVDRPRGFTPVKTVSGRPWEGTVRFIPVADSDDVFIGDIINLESGLADVGATGDTAILGAVVGVGKMDADGQPLGPFNPDNLMTRYYDDSASTHTEWGVYYAPADDVIFEAQSAADLDLAVGATCDLADAGGGDTTTGRSTAEIAASSNTDFVVVAIPTNGPDGKPQDSTLANTSYWVRVLPSSTAFGD